MKTTEPIEKLLACSDMYQLLSVFLSLPSSEMVDGIAGGTLKQDVIDIFDELQVEQEQVLAATTTLTAFAENINVDKKALLSTLRQEYTRMFRHPKEPKVDIYEALFLWELKENKDLNKNPKPRLFVSPAAMDCERLYKRAGLVGSKELNESADYFATQLEFMMAVYTKAAKARQENDEQQLKELDLIIEEFSSLHLDRWALLFFQKCKRVSQNELMTDFWEIALLFFEHFIPKFK